MKISPQDIYVIVPVYNRKELTRKLLRSLQRQTIKGFHVVVIDDGCTDGTSEMLAKEFPCVDVLEGDGNLWWTASINWGVRYAIEHHASYILTLNDDTEPYTDYIEKMVEGACRAPNAILGSCALSIEAHKYQDAGCRRDWLKAKNVPLLDLIPESKRMGLHELTHFHGRGCWVPISVFELVGFYDEKAFPQLAADDDFTFRAAKSGVKIYANLDAKILAEEEASKLFRESFSWANYKEHLFGNRGGANIFRFYKMALRHCPLRYLLSYLLVGTFRNVCGFPLQVLHARIR